ncbi:hypothetical protein AUC70_15410 [Methyloceanibacter stevinii]|uniref:Kazal-like domain-containing protein n=1 Tax=Methyloceanibacter stevinii TaxID=1774970 RepID=A0A1E3VTJ5_9HYPH|nr:hypothetical protein [Methyloceanibacter stevinii]ODR96276.1 hypothetical protein AUC70_15410 [Methyloceanibacter stevinii]
MPMRALRLATMTLALLIAASAAQAFPAGDVGAGLPQSLEAMRSGPPLVLIKKRCGPRSILLEGRCIKKSEAAGFCGPGYRVQGDKCVQGAYQGSTKGSRGCPAGQVWNAQEGCHYDD